MFTAQMGGVPGPSGPWAPTLSDTANCNLRPSTRTQPGTMRIVGALRTLDVLVAQDAQSVGRRPASTARPGRAQSDGDIMAPEICRVSSGSGLSLALGNPNPIADTSVMGRNVTPTPTVPAPPRPIRSRRGGTW